MQRPDAGNSPPHEPFLPNTRYRIYGDPLEILDFRCECGCGATFIARLPISLKMLFPIFVARTTIPFRSAATARVSGLRGVDLVVHVALASRPRGVDRVPRRKTIQLETQLELVFNYGTS
eukprot:698796-Prorocentrum_minimum.AAC.3